MDFGSPFGHDSCDAGHHAQASSRRSLGRTRCVALTGAVFAALLVLMRPVEGTLTLTPVTFRRGVVPSARFTADLSFVYSASWDGRAYATFLGRPGGADARDLLLADSRILSVSRAGDMAVLFGPQNSTHTFGKRMLATIPMAGGARRDLLTGVVDADWIPGTDTLAVVRDPGDGGPWTVEFPAGTPVYKAPAAWSLRVSPDGNRVAFFEGPEMFASAPHAMVTVIDRAGNRTPLARDWAGFGLAWAPSGREIWFTATRPGLAAPHVRAVSLSGRERAVYAAPDWLVLHDISTAGRVLLSRDPDQGMSSVAMAKTRTARPCVTRPMRRSVSSWPNSCRMLERGLSRIRSKSPFLTVFPNTSNPRLMARMTAPSPLTVHRRLMLISVVRAQPSRRVHRSVAPKAAVAAIEGGLASAHSSRPIRGRIAAANTHMGKARSRVGAVRRATARTYHSEYKSTGRHNSYATAPPRTIARISASAFHGSIASNACPNQTYLTISANVIGWRAAVER